MKINELKKLRVGDEVRLKTPYSYDVDVIFHIQSLNKGIVDKHSVVRLMDDNSNIIEACAHELA